MTETMELPQELFPEFTEEKKFIQQTMSDLIDSKSTDDFIFEPQKEFSKFIKAKFESLGIEKPVESFGAYHYSQGSSPNKNQTEFDTDDWLIMESLKEFAEIV